MLSLMLAQIHKCIFAGVPNEDAGEYMYTIHYTTCRCWGFFQAQVYLQMRQPKVKVNIQCFSSMSAYATLREKATLYVNCTMLRYLGADVDVLWIQMVACALSSFVHLEGGEMANVQVLMLMHMLMQVHLCTCVVITDCKSVALAMASPLHDKTFLLLWS